MTDFIGEEARKKFSDMPFKKGDKLWESFQTKIKEFVIQHNGEANVEEDETIKGYHPNWKNIDDVRNGKKSINTINNGCKN